MCRFQLYQECLADQSPNSREDLISVLRNCRHGSSLDRLEAARTALINLKAQLRSGESLDPGAAIKEAISQLEATP